MRRAFTLIELLVVIAIIAILAAILMPVVVSMRGLAYQFSANSNISQLGKATLMYAADNEETYPLAMYGDDSGFQTWFGRLTSAGFYDPNMGLLRAYQGKKILKDPTAKGASYMGDHSGFGYNWGYLGSNMHVTQDYSHYPYCQQAAALSEIEFPSNTVVFATSAFIYSRWLPNGDGRTYDFGFIDPLGMRPSSPNVHFRHMGTPIQDEQKRRVRSEGNALVAMVDGRSRSIKMNELKDQMFKRGEVPEYPPEE